MKVETWPALVVGQVVRSSTELSANKTFGDYSTMPKVRGSSREPKRTYAFVGSCEREEDGFAIQLEFRGPLGVFEARVRLRLFGADDATGESNGTT